MKRHAQYGLVIVLLSLCTATGVSAEPITATYAVQVFSRKYSTNIAQQVFFQPFDASFLLNLTFDTTAGPSGIYGPAIFSPDILAIPLEKPSVPDGLDISAGGITAHRNVAVATAGYDGRSSPDWFDRGYHSSLSLTGLALQPPSVANFAADLGRYPGFPNFVFSACAVFSRDPENSCGGGRFERVDYLGSATLVSVDPGAAVPEPATIGLVGAGLALLVRRRRTTYQPPSR
jgi:hypothetical protein